MVGGLSISATRALRPMVLPTLTRLREARGILFLHTDIKLQPIVGGPGTRIVSPCSLDGLPGFRVSGQWSGERFVMYAVVRGRIVYVINYRATTGSWPAIAPVFAAVVRSFRVR